MARYKKIIAENRKAHFDYHILEKYEAGIVLKGAEVKSIRIGRANLKESFARPERDAVWLYGMHINPYNFSGKQNLDPLRVRKLLLSIREIKKITGRVCEKGLSLIPLKIYFSGNYAKIELAVAKGKRLFDKKDAIKKKDLDREMGRELVDRNRR